MKYNKLVQFFFLFLFLLTILNFDYSEFEGHRYSDSFWIYLVEIVFLFFLLKNKIKLNNVYIFIFITIGIINSFNPYFNSNVFFGVMRLIVFFSLFPVAYKYKLNPIPFYVILTSFYLLRNFQGVSEPGLFVEFNLECILFLTLVLQISDNLNIRYKVFFILFNIGLLFYWRANAAFIALVVVQIYQYRKFIWVIALGVTLFMLYEFSSQIVLIDRYRYVLAYLSYFDLHFLDAFLPKAGIAIPDDASYTFKYSNAGYIKKNGLATSVLYHSNLLRMLYDLGIVFSLIFSVVFIKKLNKFINFKFVLAYLVLALSTNVFYGPLALLSMTFIKNNNEVQN